MGRPHCIITLHLKISVSEVADVVERYLYSYVLAMKGFVKRSSNIYSEGCSFIFLAELALPHTPLETKLFEYIIPKSCNSKNICGTAPSVCQNKKVPAEVELGELQLGKHSEHQG